MALFGDLPDVVVVYGQVFLIFSAQIADADVELKVQSPCDGVGITVFYACMVAPLVAEVAASAQFEVIGDDAAVQAQVVSGEGLGFRFVAQPSAQVQVAAVGAPVAAVFHQAYIQLPPADQLLPKYTSTPMLGTRRRS